MEEESSLKSTISCINRAIIESNIEYVKKQDGSVCLAKVALKIEPDNTYTFRDLFTFLHSQTDYSPILAYKEDAVILIFRDYKIFQAKASMQKIQKFTSQLFNVDLPIVGITLIDHEDDIRSLNLRLEKQFIRSKVARHPQICYDTKYFDINDDKNTQALQTLFKKVNIIKIHNLYEGVPVIDTVGIKRYEDGNLVVKIDRNKIPFFMRESFCFLEHDLIPNIIKADILRVNQSFNSLMLNNLEIVESSPVERSSIRITPSRKILATLFYEHKDICAGFIVNISENSVVLKLSKPQTNQLDETEFGRKYLNLKFQIPTPKHYIATIKTKATIFRVEDDLMIISIFPGPIAKKKLRAYISMQQSLLLSDLKSKLKETSRLFV